MSVFKLLAAFVISVYFFVNPDVFMYVCYTLAAIAALKFGSLYLDFAHEQEARKARRIMNRRIINSAKR